MANAMYDLGREHILKGEIDLDTDNLKLVCMDHADDTPLPQSDEALDDLLLAGRVATSGNLATINIGSSSGKTYFDAADVVLSTVTGDEFESINLYKDSGVESTSYLFVYIDTATGLPCTPNGGDITIQWAGATDYIFSWS